ncbi:MAG: CRISPR-associated endonuclease Cas1 [Myxococcales bacterium]|nr:CRISPR-associated endonuclease Cas1 [Myxococcales bacterium]MCB9714276.1 CRISPR-associated endonuclease Cas1 [Myxococcales bacterium]
MPERIRHSPPSESADLVPVRMCNELVYCERLFYLEHVQGYFVDSSDTVHGRSQHERAATKGRTTTVTPPTAEPDPDDPTLSELLEAPRRCVTLESASLGVRGQVDLVELHDDEAVIIEAKHGASPSHDDHRWYDHPLPYRAWPADVAQLGLYMALLRESGVPCHRAQLLYRKDRHRTEIPWSAELERFVHAVVRRAREVAALPKPPAPLELSPKCPRCSLHTICLPDEHLALAREAAGQTVPPLRRIVPGADDRAVLHVLTPGSALRKDGQGIRLSVRGIPDPQRILVKDLAQVALYGPSQITAQCMTMLLLEDVPVAHHTGSGRLLGMTMPLATRNVTLRRAQFRTADDPERCLVAARALVVAKIRNQRTVLRRYRTGHTADDPLDERLPAWADPTADDPETQAAVEQRATTIGEALARMRNAWRGAQRATDIDALRGHEGDAAATYFGALPSILPAPWPDELRGRSRRPPRDRVNAMLGFGYAMLTRDATAALGRVGLDPMVGLFHTTIPGRPALALDLLEPFRPAWVDASILRLLATGGITPECFIRSGDGVFLTDPGRRALVAAYERRADERITHPRFGYRMSYRRMLELEARVLAKWMAGEIDEFSPLLTR